MTADAQSLTCDVAPVSSARSGRWIASPLFDGTFFLFSPLVVLPPVILAMTVSPRFSVLFFFLAFPHYLSTATFFFWDENQARHKARWIAFFLGPIIIAAAYAVLFYFQAARIASVILFLWNTFHVSRQSGGILSIYRHRAGVFHPWQRDATNYAILFTTLYLSFWNIETHPHFSAFLTDISPSLTGIVQTTLFAAACGSLLFLGIAFRARIRAGQPLPAAEVLFLLTSIAIFHPYLWMKNSATATAVMLLPHYLQYLGIVWLLHRRRFRTPEGTRPQRALQKVSSSTPLLLLVLFGIGLAFAGGATILGRAGHYQLFETLYILLAFEHFYLDGLFWAFRDPSVRKGIGPYLTTYEQAASAA